MDMKWIYRALIIFSAFAIPYFLVSFVMWDFPNFSEWKPEERLLYFLWQSMFIPIIGFWIITND